MMYFTSTFFYEDAKELGLLIRRDIYSTQESYFKNELAAPQPEARTLSLGLSLPLSWCVGFNLSNLRSTSIPQQETNPVALC